MDRLTDSYIYIIFRQDGRPCYVGKGRGARWRRHDRHKQNPHLGAIFDQAGGKLPVVKIKDGITDDEARALEVLLIAAIGREKHGGPLVNLTDGGDGTVGAIMSDNWRANRSEKAKELWANPDRANIAKETAVMTDEAGQYAHLGKEFASHEYVNHSAGEYGRGDVHTNTLEGFYSIFKRGHEGHRQISP
jgi:hypothetical protein